LRRFHPGPGRTDLVTKKDMSGTDHPMTYGHGQFDKFKAGQRFNPGAVQRPARKEPTKYLARAALRWPRSETLPISRRLQRL
jgi:hypothetical protein